MRKRYLITGGAGFIGTALCRHLLKSQEIEILVYDKLTYAANQSAIAEFKHYPRYSLVQADIGNFHRLDHTLQRFKPTAVLHLAAESHVDRSINAPSDFIDTNIRGTMVLLEATRKYLQSIPIEEQQRFRFLHVSTDEVFGDLGDHGMFDENSPYKPSSPYAASKAASDHLVRAWTRTYGIPAIISNCTNNYGPEQYPEKLIPLMCYQALKGFPLPVYGDGSQVRDWIHVQDHIEALLTILAGGRVGETYAVGARNELCNMELVRAICQALNSLAPEATPYETLVTQVADRPGHDLRYAVDPTRLEQELGWQPRIQFECGLFETVHWYLREFQNNSHQKNLADKNMQRAIA